MSKFKLYKWIYKLGYDKARDEVFTLLERGVQFNQTQEQVKSIESSQDKLNKEQQEERFKTTPRDHAQRRKELEDIQRTLDPERYPNIDRFMEMFE